MEIRRVDEEEDERAGAGFLDETAKWEKITYAGIVTCTILSIYNLSKGHPHHEDPPDIKPNVVSCTTLTKALIPVEKFEKAMANILLY
ncbi:uncharacterized protein A4U43_C10F13220 [Asparagus officinalis]|uniref:Uncharacterized protein n=1 Tax=Asparagus officinalis TaxID=4686 RepID=A0A5P1E2R8_ASPOF|nr:uncharacterized protein A4U43_C10F13220 [Asparagus officinalis]